jgi:hypothetical protein
MPDLWTDLDAESRKPGPTMTITKAQYATLRAALDGLDPDRLAHDFAMKYGLAALPDRPVSMTYAEAVHLEKGLATFLRARCEAIRDALGRQP